ncbi:MAG: SH3 domain-containing protein [Cyclobacteriaceae bacterium]
MLKRQKSYSIFTILFFTVLSFNYLECNAQTDRERLEVADSLFKEAQYIQSFDIYNGILLKGKKISPAMLLKMAYIKEGLGDYTLALYYLNLYYLQSSDERALKKMAEMGEKHKLSGYTYDDMQFFLNIYHRYQDQFYLGIMSIILLVFALMIYQKRITKQRPIAFGIVYIILLVVVFWVNNFGLSQQMAIIERPSSYLMKGPSAASGLIDIANKGHRVEILSQNDVWIKIKWQDDVAYIRENNLRKIQL